MTLFEKIYFTCLILNIVFFLLGQATDTEWMCYLIFIQIGLTAIYVAIKLILWIWGINIDLFPCIKFVSN